MAAAAHFRIEARILSRSDRPGGRSIVAAAAYRSGTKLRDEKYDTVHHYGAKSGVVHSEIVAPDNAPSWVYDREKLWNAVEAKEDESNRRASAQLSREFLFSLPKELDAEQRRELVMGFVNEELVSRGMVCDVSIHESKDGRNPHAHILTTTREIGPEGFGKKNREWNKQELLCHWREAGATHINLAYEKAGHELQADHRSLKDRGIDREPEPKIGVDAMALQREGKVADPDRVKMARQVRLKNELMPYIRDVQQGREIEASATWMERASVFMRRVQRDVSETVKSTIARAKEAWQSYLDNRQKRDEPGPEPQPEVSR